MQIFKRNPLFLADVGAKGNIAFCCYNFPNGFDSVVGSNTQPMAPAPLTTNQEQLIG